jgi:uncharacterized protein (TIGR03435 family)
LTNSSFCPTLGEKCSLSEFRREERKRFYFVDPPAIMGYKILFVLGMALAQSTLYAQKFDVASVKPSSLQDPRQRQAQVLPGGRVRYIGMPLLMIIMPAYQVWEFQVSGGPDWIRTAPWDIEAEAEGVRLTIDQLRPRLQSILEERFQLRVHRETKLMPGYALVVEEKGPKVLPNTDGKRLFDDGRGRLVAKKASMGWLVGALTQILGQVVIDKTDLSGDFDITLEWAPDSAAGADSINNQTPTTLSGSDRPSIFTALKEQLGLKLEPRRAPTDVLVIDSVQLASPN